MVALRGDPLGAASGALDNPTSALERLPLVTLEPSMALVSLGIRSVPLFTMFLIHVSPLGNSVFFFPKNNLMINPLDGFADLVLLPVFVDRSAATQRQAVIIDDDETSLR